MALITDPDNLTYSVNSATNMLRVDTTAKTITLVQGGALTTDGVTGQCVYSKLKEIWKNDTTAIKFAFPIEAITEEKFDLINAWDWGTTGTRELLRSCGWALKNTSGVSLEEYAGVISLGSLEAGTQAYYQQSSNGAAINFVLADEVNQAVKVYGDASHGNFDNRSYMKLFAREQGDVYAGAALTDIGVTTMTYQVYRFPLATSSDTKVTHSDVTVAAYGVTITWFAAAQPRSIGGINRNFHVIINGNSRTAEEIYEAVQRLLRQSSDIDSGAGSKIGNVTNSLLKFVGDTLYTQSDSTGGVFIDNYQSTDVNRLIFVDDTAIERTFPYTAALVINFGDNLKNDTDAKYWVYFTNDDAGANAGNDFGTTGAILVQDDAAASMTGNVSGASSVTKSYAYDTNVQRGAGSDGDDAPITVVGIGLNTGQYVKATGTITRSTTNSITLTSSLERNYSNV